MTYIIAEPCVGVCDTACVEVCPVDCIHFTKDKDIGEEAKAEGFDPEAFHTGNYTKITQQCGYLFYKPKSPTLR